MEDRTEIVLGTVEDLPEGANFDAATLIGVLHHLPGNKEKEAVLQSIAARLKPGAPLILAGNHFAYANEPLMLKAWGERWRMHGASADEIKSKLGKILQGVDPPPSEAAVIELLAKCGFELSRRFFSSLFWGAWIAFRAT